MEIKCEISLVSFEFWAGAVSSRNRFSYDELEELEGMIEDCCEDITDTWLNDLFWFEPECLCEWLGIDFDEWIERPDDYILNN